MSIAENPSCCEKIHNKMFSMDDPNQGPKCCFCVQLKLGISLICIFSFIDLINEIQMVSRAMTINIVVGAVCLPAIMFMVVCCIMFTKYCKKDSVRNRHLLVVGTSLNVFANFMMLIVLAASPAFDEEM